MALTSFAFKSVNAVFVAAALADVLDVIATGSGSISDTILTEPLVTPTTFTLDVSVIPKTAHIRLMNVVIPSFL